MRTFHDITPDQLYVPPEFILRRFGMSYKTLDRLLNEVPELHEIRLTRPGKTVGRRLIHWPSFEKFIESRRVPKKENMAA
jgi:hypothetical protein